MRNKDLPPADNLCHGDALVSPPGLDLLSAVDEDDEVVAAFDRLGAVVHDCLSCVSLHDCGVFEDGDVCGEV